VPKNVTFRLNGRERTVTVDDPSEPLLYVLRDRFELNGPKFGCGLAQCGACTVLFNQTAIRSCQYPIASVEGARITTVEGLGNEHTPHPLQTAFIEEQAAQCGYCTNGMIMSAAALLHKNPHPTEAQIKAALDGNLCRCATHLRIVRAVKRAAAAMVKQAQRKTA
jgi:nicotinate dehydrogenase subunit A